MNVSVVFPKDFSGGGRGFFKLFGMNKYIIKLIISAFLIFSSVSSHSSNYSFNHDRLLNNYGYIINLYSRCFSLAGYHGNGGVRSECNFAKQHFRFLKNHFPGLAKKTRKHKRKYKKHRRFNIYKPNRVLDVDISMSDEDWEKLRFEGPQVSDWSFGCQAPSYNNYFSEVTINGRKTLQDVAVRKRGRIGAVTVLRPALNVSFNVGEGNEDRTFKGVSQIGLINNRQDPATIRSCLSRSALEDMGLPVQQCNFAQVTAQGEDLGVYSNVEPIKEKFLKREFGDASGNLYSAKRAGDFNESHLPLLKLETNKDINDRSDLDRVLAAMQAPDDEVWDALNEVINMDQFLTFSAAESIIGHKNGYNGFQNNTFIYSNPLDNGRFHFIPSGTDQSFLTTYHLTMQQAPASVYLGSELMQRLWNTPGFQERYDNRMRELLRYTWNERSLKRQARRMARLISADMEEVERIYEFIDNRRANIEAELGTERVWERPLMADVTGCPEPTAFSGSFDVFWGQDFQQQGTMSIDVQELDGTVTTIVGNGYVNFDDRGDGLEANNIRLFGQNEQGERFLLLLAVLPQLWTEGDVLFHSAETIGAFFKFQENGLPTRLGLTSDGGIFFENISSTEGGRIKGTFSSLYVEPNN